MKRITLTLITFILIAAPAYALFESQAVKKAKEFMIAGMYPQAITLLQKRINDKPTDAEAHFVLGECYINTNQFGVADSRFESAVRIESDYGYKIGGKWKIVAMDALSKRKIDKSLNLYGNAVRYQPDLKTAVATELVESGKQFLDQNRSDISDKLFSTAVRYDSSQKQKISPLTREYGQKLLAIAKAKPKKERKEYVNEALKYLTQKDVDQVLSPPIWRKVPDTYFELEGHGLDTILLVGKGISLERGWRKVAKIDNGVMFKHLYGAGYTEYKGGFELEIGKTYTIKNGWKFKIPKGKKVKLWVERLETSY